MTEEHIVKANQFVLVDEKGNLRAMLGMTEYGTGLVLFDENDKSRAVLAADEDWSELVLLDENGNPRAQLDWGEDTTGSQRSGLCLYDEDGAVGAELFDSLLSLCGEQGAVRAMLTFSPLRSDGPGLVLVDEEGNPRVWLAANKHGPRRCLIDEEGNPRAWLNALKNEPGLRLCDEEGKTYAWLTVTEDMPGKKSQRLCLGGRYLPPEKRRREDGTDGFVWLRARVDGGDPHALLAALKDGLKLRLCDEEGKPRAWLTGPGLHLSAEEGYGRGGWPDVHKDVPLVALSDEDGRIIWSAPR